MMHSRRCALAPVESYAGVRVPRRGGVNFLSFFVSGGIVAFFCWNNEMFSKWKRIDVCLCVSVCVFVCAENQIEMRVPKMSKWIILITFYNNFFKVYNLLFKVYNWPEICVLKLHLECVCWNCTWNVCVETVLKMRSTKNNSCTP